MLCNEIVVWKVERPNRLEKNFKLAVTLHCFKHRCTLVLTINVKYGIPKPVPGSQVEGMGEVNARKKMRKLP